MVLNLDLEAVDRTAILHPRDSGSLSTDLVDVPLVWPEDAAPGDSGCLIGPNAEHAQQVRRQLVRRRWP
jgi:hypothetical protein